MDRRAYFTLLKLKKEQDPSLPVEQWQIDDYRSMDEETLFSLLEDLGFALDKESYLEIAESVETPEDFVHELVVDNDEELFAKTYLIIFELWRRFLPEKLSLSIFCDELDFQISLYDSQDLENPEGLENVLSYLQVLMDENIDEGEDPKEVFASVAQGMANNLEDFLFDFIAENIELANLSYAEELIEAFAPCIQESLWFDLLGFKLLAQTDVGQAEVEGKKLVQEALKEDDFEYNIELLASLVQVGDRSSFEALGKKSLKLAQTEEDLKDLMEIALDFYTCIDCQEKEEALLKLLEKRKKISPVQKINPKDADLALVF
jgi:hypothetical protein